MSSAAPDAGFGPTGEAGLTQSAQAIFGAACHTALPEESTGLAGENPS